MYLYCLDLCIKRAGHGAAVGGVDEKLSRLQAQKMSYSGFRLCFPVGAKVSS